MKVGTRVEVRSRFDGSWLEGFRLEEEGTDEAGRVAWRTVRRISDRMVLPARFPARDVRRSASQRVRAEIR